MINYAIRLVLTGILVFLIPRLLSDITVDSITTAIIVAFVMSLLNTFIKPVLQFIAFPITLITLGLFSLVITLAVVYLCSYLVNGFNVEGIIAPLIFSFLLSIANGMLSSFQE